MRFRTFLPGHGAHVRSKPGDKDMQVCQRCGAYELRCTKQMRDKADNPWS